MTRTIKTRLLLAASLCLGLSISAEAQVPKLLSHQGRLTDAQGVALADGRHAADFSLHDDVTGGSELWRQSITVDVVDGIYDVLLTLGAAAPSFDRQYYLEVEIAGSVLYRAELRGAATAHAAVHAAAESVGSEALANDTVAASELQLDAVDSEKTGAGAVGWRSLSLETGFLTDACPGLQPSASRVPPGVWTTLCTATVASADLTGVLSFHVPYIEVSMPEGDPDVRQVWSRFELCRGVAPHCDEVLGATTVGSSPDVPSSGAGGRGSGSLLAPASGGTDYFARALWQQKTGVSPGTLNEVKWTAQSGSFEAWWTGVMP